MGDIFRGAHVRHVTALRDTVRELRNVVDDVYLSDREIAEFSFDAIMSCSSDVPAAKPMCMRIAVDSEIRVKYGVGETQEASDGAEEDA